jgi:Peptidase M15
MYPLVRSVDVNDFIPGSTFFRWCQALWLPKWGIYCYPTQEQAIEIIGTARVMDVIRNRVKKTVEVHSWLRPENYNTWPSPYGVSGAKLSAHRLGMAVDFSVNTIPCDEVREMLKPELERLKIRMEDFPKSAWVHIDRRDPGGSGRFFKP